MKENIFSKKILKKGAFLTAFTLLTIMLVKCKTTTSDIDSWVDQGKISKVGGFVIDRVRAEQSSKVVIHGINVLADAKADSVLRKVGSKIGQNISISHTNAVVQALNERSLVPTDSDRLCKLAVKNENKISGLKELVERHNKKYLNECIKKSISSYEFPSEAGKVNRELEKIIKKYESSRYKTKTIKEKVEKYISNKEKESELKNRISELRDKLDKEKEDIERIEDKIEDAKLISGYIVGMVKESTEGILYEFAFTDYQGRPTRNHAYLLTQETEFTSKGSFRMRASKIREVKTKIKEEMGGFEQSWPLFSEIKNYNEEKEELKKSYKKVRKIKRKLPEITEEKNKLEKKKGEYRREVKSYLTVESESEKYRAKKNSSTKLEASMFKGGANR
ncbi:hypothetical protein, partial [Salinibacter ruber]|uniref:hypothetical protein n=1 Tax=Salinibacter ruber TaxID=146919 RepID=UPI002167227C